MIATSVVLEKVYKKYGDLQVVHGIDLNINPGEFTVFVGPSGCGKSTLLRMIAGLEPITGGDLVIDGQRMNDIPAAKRGIAMVFQSPRRATTCSVPTAKRSKRHSPEDIHGRGIDFCCAMVEIVRPARRCRRRQERAMLPEIA